MENSKDNLPHWFRWTVVPLVIIGIIGMVIAERVRDEWISFKINCKW